MSATKTAPKAKPTSAPRVDPKKVTTLRETFPFLSEEAAALHLAEANGNMAAATELVLNGERWKTTSGAKPRKVKEEKAVEEPARRPDRKRDDRDREPRGERKPFVKRENAKPAAPAVPEVTAAQVQQKDVTSSAWVKGQGLSFVDMVKQKKEQPKAPEAVPPPPPPPAVVEVAPPAPAAEAAAPAVATEEKPAKQRRERKPRTDAPTTAAADEAAAPVAVPAPAVVAPAQPVAPKPVVVKHVLRFDRVDELLLPSHMNEIALRSASQYTYSGTPGVDQSPPPQPQPVNSFQQQFTMQRAWGAPDHNVAPRWDNPNANSWGQPPPQQRFTAYQPNTQRNFNQFPGGYGQQNQPRFNGNIGGHHNHHRGHEQQASSDAYNAIREPYSHHTGATW